MDLTIAEEAVTRTALEEYATVPNAFRVDRILELTLIDGGLGGMSLTETAVDNPYISNSDAIEGAAPSSWPGQFDTSNWRLICAWRDGARAGGAVIAVSTPDLRMLEDRDDIAVLWDIRVSPAHRKAGVGSALFRAVEHRAGALGCRWLKIETQNVNVAACRFYLKMGCTLGAVNRFAYPRQPGEIQLLWRKPLTPPSEKVVHGSAGQ